MLEDNHAGGQSLQVPKIGSGLLPEADFGLIAMKP